MYAACVVLATTRLDVNHAVRARLGGRRTSFASFEEARALTGMELGGVTVFGLPPGLPILIDRRVMDRPEIILGGGSRSWKVKAPPAILLALPGVEVIDGLALEPPAPSCCAARVVAARQARPARWFLRRDKRSVFGRFAAWRARDSGNGARATLRPG